MRSLHTQADLDDSQRDPELRCVRLDRTGGEASGSLGLFSFRAPVTARRREGLESVLVGGLGGSGTSMAGLMLRAGARLSPRTKLGGHHRPVLSTPCDQLIRYHLKACSSATRAAPSQPASSATQPHDRNECGEHSHTDDNQKSGHFVPSCHIIFDLFHLLPQARKPRNSGFLRLFY